MKINYIVVHTAAFSGRNCDANKIDEWHRARGWNGIGYHYVILNDKHDKKADGTIESGRDENTSGAHAYGINSQSLGICCVGHGDHHDFTAEQYQSLYQLLGQLCQKHQVPTDNVIGHRELNHLISRGLLSEQYKTGKTCPGNKVDMTIIRQTLANQLLSPLVVDKENEESELNKAEEKQLSEAILILKKHKQHFNNAGDELEQFLNHPEVIELINDE